MKYIRTIFILTGLIIFSASCTAGDHAEAEETVNTFIRALHSGNRTEAAAAAPFIDELTDEQMKRLQQAVQPYEKWEITEKVYKNRTAVFTLRFSSPSGSVNIQFPLAYRNNQWEIQEALTFSATIDVIPAE